MHAGQIAGEGYGAYSPKVDIKHLLVCLHAERLAAIKPDQDSVNTVCVA